MRYVYLDWAHLRSCYSILYRKMERQNFKPDTVIALLRGGVVPARIIADYFGIHFNFFALDVKFYTGIGETLEEPQIKYFNEDIRGDNVLIVDDIWDSGKTMNAVLDKFSDRGFKTATLYWRNTAEGKPDFYGKVAEENHWIIFPWEYHEMRKKIEALDDRHSDS